MRGDLAYAGDQYLSVADAYDSALEIEMGHQGAIRLFQPQAVIWPPTVPRRSTEDASVLRKRGDQ